MRRNVECYPLQPFEGARSTAMMVTLPHTRMKCASELQTHRANHCGFFGTTARDRHTIAERPHQHGPTTRFEATPCRSDTRRPQSPLTRAPPEWSCHSVTAEASRTQPATPPVAHVSYRQQARRSTWHPPRRCGGSSRRLRPGKHRSSGGSPSLRDRP